MIVSAMRALRDREMDQAALGVDAANPTGAFGLYESLGFRAVHGMEVLARPFDEWSSMTRHRRDIAEM